MYACAYMTAHVCCRLVQNQYSSSLGAAAGCHQCIEHVGPNGGRSQIQKQNTGRSLGQAHEGV